MIDITAQLCYIDHRHTVSNGDATASPSLFWRAKQVAAVQATDDGNRVTCDLPACKAERGKRGQENGRWLFNVAFTNGTVAVTTRCHECGGVHTVVFPVPNEEAESSK